METFCAKLPKIELHAHLNGSLSRETLKKNGCTDDAIFQFQLAKQTTLDQVFEVFKIAHKATSTRENLYQSTKKVIEEFASDNVIYLELRTTPRKETDMTEDDYVETVIKGVLDSTSSEIMVKLILSIDRRRSYDQQAQTLKTILKYKKLYPNLVRGIDLSGDPAKGDFFRDIFEEARINGLFVAMHCAEIKNDTEVMEILNFKPDRLGHATFVHPNFNGSADIWQLYTKLPIPVECCLTSNVVCLTAKSYEEHHVQEWIRTNMPFCIATDDKGVLDTTLSKEFHIVQKNFSLNEKDLWKISKNSISYSFALPEEKSQLNEKLDEWKLKNIL